MGTWLSPASDELTYVANFRQHARRLREVCKILGDHGLRFGMEYVGPMTSWTKGRYPFIHTMAEMKDLIAESLLAIVRFSSPFSKLSPMKRRIKAWSIRPGSPTATEESISMKLKNWFRSSR